MLILPYFFVLEYSVRKHTEHDPFPWFLGSVLGHCSSIGNAFSCNLGKIEERDLSELQTDMKVHSSVSSSSNFIN